MAKDSILDETSKNILIEEKYQTSVHTGDIKTSHSKLKMFS